MHIGTVSALMVKYRKLLTAKVAKGAQGSQRKKGLYDATHWEVLGFHARSPSASLRAGLCHARGDGYARAIVRMAMTFWAHCSAFVRCSAVT
jgi:hypothetical protein